MRFAWCWSLMQALLWWCEEDGNAHIEREVTFDGRWGYALYRLRPGEEKPEYL